MRSDLNMIGSEISVGSTHSFKVTNQWNAYDHTFNFAKQNAKDIIGIRENDNETVIRKYFNGSFHLKKGDMNNFSIFIILSSLSMFSNYFHRLYSRNGTNKFNIIKNY